MSPRFFEGDYVVCYSHPWQRYAVNDVVVVNHPRFGIIIKRIVRLCTPSKEVLLAGDNLLSTSSDELGWQPYRNILGKVFWRVAKPL